MSLALEKSLMSEMESIIPDTERSEDCAIVVKKLFTNTERLQKATEALALLPDTVDGSDALFCIMDLIDSLHQTPYDDVEGLFTRIRIIYKSWNITLPI